MTNYYPTVNVDPPEPEDPCEHEHWEFHKGTRDHIGYVECCDCGAYTYEWDLESESIDGFDYTMIYPEWSDND